MKLHQSALTFLTSIQEHNSRKFFALVKPLYEEIHENLKQICQACIDQASKIDDWLQWLTPKDCLFRIYRDARRLQDGDPIYKQNRWFVLSPWGKNSSLPGYYVHIEPWDKSFFWGWVYRPEPNHLRSLREYFAKHGDAYKKILKTASFKKAFWQPTGTSLTRPPKWFTPDTPHLDLIQQKQHLIYAPITDKQLSETEDFVALITNYVKLAYPWMHFLTQGCLYKKSHDSN